jgi:CRP/FNR family transcriptional regulator, cyclic AMP receptor protein
MPSAQHVEIDEQPAAPATGDLHSLLCEMRGSNISNLNSLHGRGKILFAEGDPARGVYILRTGKASVSISSSEGRLVILRMAQAGDVLGLNSVMRNCSHEATVKTLGPCRTDFISRAEVIELMRKSEAGTQAILKILSDEVTALTERARSLLLPQTASARLAKLLLEWCKENGLHHSQAVRIDKVFTHEEIAQMICSSRETVTRLLATLSRRQIIRIMSDSILIRDRAALETLALG